MENDNVIVYVNDAVLGLENIEVNNPSLRYGARGIVLNKDGKVAVFNKVNKNEYKLPGGGVEENEDIMEAFKREVLEETGCEIEIISKLGLAIEEKGQTNFKQVSHIFLSKVLNDTNELHLTEKELDEGSRIIWVDLDEAYKLINASVNNIIGSKYDTKYQSLFMVKRDALILNYYILNKK